MNPNVLFTLKDIFNELPDYPEFKKGIRRETADMHVARMRAFLIATPERNCVMSEENTAKDKDGFADALAAVAVVAIAVIAALLWVNSQ